MVPPSLICGGYPTLCGPVSLVGIATDYWLDGPGIESGGGRYSAVQTGPGAHPIFCTMGTGSFPGVKYGRGVLTTHPLLVPWSWKSRAIPLPTLWVTNGPVTGSLYLYPRLFPQGKSGWGGKLATDLHLGLSYTTTLH